MSNNIIALSASAENEVVGSGKIDFYAAIYLPIVVASVVSIILLCFKYFDIPLVIFGAIVLSFGLLKLFRLEVVTPSLKLGYVSIVIISIAFLLRSDLYPHLMGGQDQGLYVNMAEVLLQEKELDFEDGFRKALNAEEKAIYAQSNMSSVPLIDNDKSTYTIDFYPLHPIWMAISKWAFGPGFHTLSLLFFSALGITGGYYLAREVFEDDRAAKIAAFFLSINPALVFFSKFPVAEIVAFAFTVNGFLFIAKSVKANANRVRWFYWVVSLLSFNCFFFVRMQFFMYLPFFFFVMIYALIKINEEKYNKNTWITLISFVIAVFFTFALSLVFYYFNQPGLFNAMILGHILSLLDPKLIWPAIIGSLVLLLLLLPAFASVPLLARLRAYFAKLVGYGWMAIPWLLPIAFIASIPSIFNLYQNGRMHPFPFSVPVGSDIWLIRYHAIYRLGLMLSPVALVIIFFSPLFKISFSPKVKVLILFVSTVWLSILLQPWIPYLYYYGRYLTSEMIPYSIILFSGIVSFLIASRKRLGFFVLFIVGLYFFLFSMAQYNKKESEDLGFYDELLRHVTKSDVVLAAGLDDRQYVPLRINHGLRVFPLTDRRGESISVPQETFFRLASLAEKKGGRLFLLTWNHVNQVNGVTRVAQLPFNDRFFSNGEHIWKEGVLNDKGRLPALFLPVKYKVNARNYFLYQVEFDGINALFNKKCASELNLTSDGAMFIDGLTGFSIPEAHGRWTTGNKSSYKCLIDSKELRPRKAVLDLMAFAPDKHKQSITISANGGVPVSASFDYKNSYNKIEVPISSVGEDGGVFLELLIPTAISPKELGMSDDARRLGVSIRKISLIYD